MPLARRFPYRRRSCRILGYQLHSSRWLLLVLGIIVLTLHGQLWFSDDGYNKTRNLRLAVAEQRALNQELRERNASLDAEVINLKQGDEAAEERARTDLGMIGPSETFYQVVPVATATR